MKKIMGFIICILLLTTNSISVLGNDWNADSSNKEHIYYNSEFSRSLNQVDEWPMFRHDLNHTGYSTSPAPDTNNTIWIYETESSFESSPAVVNGKVYVGSLDSNVYCLDAETGTYIWNYTTGFCIYFSSPTVIDGKVYIGSGDGNVYCLDADTGTYIWSYKTDDVIWSSPAIADNKVYIGSNDNNVYCLDADTGTYIWSYTTGDNIQSSPAIVNGKVYIGSNDNNVYCLDAETGTNIWNYTTGALIQSSPAVVNGKVYIGSRDGNVYCLDAGAGTYIWSHKPGGQIDSSPAVFNGKVYFGSWNGNLYCLDADTGWYIWNYSVGSTIRFSSPAIADNKVYIGSYENIVYCLNADKGKHIWSYTTGGYVWSSPTITDDRVFITSYDGNIYAFSDETQNPPDVPTIDGPLSGKIRISYNFSFNSIDPDGDDIYYYIKWGDGYVKNWDGPHPSGEDFIISHTYANQDTFTIQAKAKDVYDAESNWSYFEVEIPRTKTTFCSYYNWFLAHFQILERLLSMLL